MECKDFQGMFSAWLDGEIDPPKKTMFQEHLDNCPACAFEIRKFNKAVTYLGRLPEVKLPVDFIVRVHERIDAESGWRGILRFPMRLLWRMPLPSKSIAAAAIILIIFGVGVLVGQKYTPASEDLPVMAKSLSHSAYHRGEAAPYIAGLQSSATPIDVSWVDTRKHNTAGDRLNIETPSELIMAILKNDPNFRQYEIHSELLGAVVLTPEKLYRVTISTADFLRMRAIIESQGGRIPTSLEEAVRYFPVIRVEILPSPLSPVK